MTAPFYVEMLKLIAPALVGACLSAFFVARWKSRDDALAKLFDKLDESINAAGNIAHEYWKTEYTDELIELKSVQVQASIARIDGIRSTLAKFVSWSASNEISEAASKFLRETTGGSFGVHNRRKDITRAKSGLLASVAFSNACRRAQLMDLQGWKRRR